MLLRTVVVVVCSLCIVWAEQEGQIHAHLLSGQHGDIDSTLKSEVRHVWCQLPNARFAVLTVALRAQDWFTESFKPRSDFLTPTGEQAACFLDKMVHVGTVGRPISMSNAPSRI
jgi:hypothetical protein